MKARGVVLGKLLEQIKQVPSRENRDLIDRVNTFNAVALPDMFCGIDGNGMLHVTLIGAGRNTQDEPRQVMHTADVIWAYDPVNETYTNLKDRTGDFS